MEMVLCGKSRRLLRILCGSVGMLILLLHWKSSMFIESRKFSRDERLRVQNKTSAKVSEDGMIQIHVDEKKQTYSSVAEVKHVSFLKVHKTGSSTVQNIFLRFGESRNLTFVLAHAKGGESGRSNVISYRNSITDRNVVPPPANKTFDILCCHVIYNWTSFGKILPKDSVYVGIVREPFSRFQSAIRMWHPKYVMQTSRDHPITTFAREPLRFEPEDPRKSWTNNRMAVEYGFPTDLFPGKTQYRQLEKINEYLKRIDGVFDFIIINERFSESLVYMKRILGWRMKDILFVEHMKKKTKPNSNELVTDEHKTLLSKFLYLDITLYEFALERFEKQIKQTGPGFQTEVAYFKDLNMRSNAFCQNKSAKYFILFDRTKWNEEFSITRTDCKLISMKETAFIKLVRLKQYGTV